MIELYPIYRYRGFVLFGNTIVDEQSSFIQINSECKEINFTLVLKELDYNIAINKFKEGVDSYIIEQDKKLEGIGRRILKY